MDNEKRPVPWTSGSPAWESLLARAVMSLDESEAAAHEKRRDECDRRYARRLEKAGLMVSPYDWYQVREVLVEYDRCGRFDEALRRCNGKESECLEAKSWDEDVRLVWDFLVRQSKERLAARASDIAQDAQEGLRRLVTDEACRLDTKAIKIALESAAPELYGGGGRGDRGAGEEGPRRLPVGGGGIMINIIGDAAAKLMEPPKGRSGGVFVDV